MEDVVDVVDVSGEELERLLAEEPGRVAGVTVCSYPPLEYAQYLMCDPDLVVRIARALGPLSPGVHDIALAAAVDSDAEGASLLSALVSDVLLDPTAPLSKSVSLSPGEWSVGGRSLLHLAGEKGNIEVAKVLLKASPGLVDATDDAGATPWMVAAVGAAGSMWSETGKERRGRVASLLDPERPLLSGEEADALAGEWRSAARKVASDKSGEGKEKLRAHLEGNGDGDGDGNVFRVLILAGSGVYRPWDTHWYAEGGRVIKARLEQEMEGRRVSVSMLWDGYPDLGVSPEEDDALDEVGYLDLLATRLVQAPGVPHPHYDLVIGHSAGGNVALGLAGCGEGGGISMGHLVCLACGIDESAKATAEEAGIDASHPSFPSLSALNWERIGANVARTTLIHAKDDPVVSSVEAESIASLLSLHSPHVDVVSVPGENHFLGTDVPPVLLETVLLRDHVHDE